MAAGLGFKTFTTGEVLTAADVNGYLMQGVLVFASEAARNSAITSPQEGQFAYTKDNNSLWYYTGSAWVASGATGDIEGVTAGTGISGGGTSGTVTITNSMATEITAKGDLIVGTGNATFDNLPAGSAGDTLVADSAATTGLRYQSAYNGNGIINGGMDIWQRGTSFALTSPQVAYTADRWLGRQLGTNVTYSQQASGLTGIQYGLRIQRPVSTTGVNDQPIYYQFETPDSYRFAGQTVTLSFYAKAGANFSATSSIMSSAIYSGTGTNQNITSGAYTGQATVVSQNNTLTTSYQRFSVTGTVGATATQIAIILSATPTGTAGANDWYEITGLQLELGSVATSFKRAGGGTLQGELAACQRYYQRFTEDVAYTTLLLGMANATTTCVLSAPLQVAMRTSPTFAAANVYLYSLNNIKTVSSYTNRSSKTNVSVIANTTGLTGGEANRLEGQGSSNGYVEMSAEL